MESTVEVYRDACLDKFVSVGIKGSVLNRIAKAYTSFNYNMELEFRYLNHKVSRIDYEAMRKVNILIGILKHIESGNDDIVLNVQINMPIFKMVILDYLRNERGIDTVLDANKLKLNNINYGTVDLEELKRIGILISWEGAL